MEVEVHSLPMDDDELSFVVYDMPLDNEESKIEIFVLPLGKESEQHVISVAPTPVKEFHGRDLAINRRDYFRDFELRKIDFSSSTLFLQMVAIFTLAISLCIYIRKRQRLHNPVLVTKNDQVDDPSPAKPPAPAQGRGWAMAGERGGIAWLSKPRRQSCWNF
jgi:hypothetical protein